MLQDEGGIYIFELRKNPGLKANVISMYKSHFRSEGFYRPRIAENVTISGKLKEHTVDIYFEFIQMNNLERTVIKVIEGTKVTENDMWEFANVLKDLHFFAKGIIYYDDRVSSGAKKVAELTHIDLKKFDLLDEVRKSALSAIKVMLPDEEVIGDPCGSLWKQSKIVIRIQEITRWSMIVFYCFYQRSRLLIIAVK